MFLYHPAEQAKVEMGPGNSALPTARPWSPLFNAQRLIAQARRMRKRGPIVSGSFLGTHHPERVERLRGFATVWAF